MNRSVQFVLTNRATVAPDQVKATATHIQTLIAQAEAIGNDEIALNALIGAFINYAVQHNYLESAIRMIAVTAQAVKKLEAISDTEHAAKTINEELVDVGRQIRALVDPLRHEVALSALFAELQTTAERHPCCAQVIGQECITLGNNLLKTGADGNPPAGVSVH